MIETLTIAAGAATFVAALVRGARQRREVGASMLRVATVAAVLAIVVVLPLVAAMWFGVSAAFGKRVFFDELGMRHLVREPASWQSGHIETMVAFVAAVVLAKVGLTALRRPDQWVARHARLPELDDASVRQRIRELAAAMRAPMPRVLLRGTSASSLDANAFVGGVLGPVLVVFDGILHRLSVAERDAVLAHELAHVARRSIIRRLAAVWVGIGLGVAASAVTAPWVAIAVLLGCAVGIGRAYAYHDELRCDRMAAQTTSFAATAAALGKIHAVAGVPPGWREPVVHALLGHPTLAVRRASLARHAPAGVLPHVVEARRDAWIAKLLLAGWFAALVAGVALGRQPALEPYAALGVVAVALAPGAAILLWQGAPLLEAWRLGLLRLPLPLLVALVGFVGLIASFAALAALESPWPAFAALLSLLLVVGSPLVRRRERRLLARARVAMGAHDFAGAVTLLESLPPRARARHLRVLAEARTAAGDEVSAIAELEQRLAKAPDDHAVRLELALLLLPRDPARALELGEGIERRVPRTRWVAQLRASALRRLGRLNEAAECIDRLLARNPRSGHAQALASRIAAAAGEVERARRRLREAQQLQPGDAIVVLAEADVELAAGDLEAASRALAEARDRARQQPLAHLADDLAELEARLHARRGDLRMERT